MRKVSYYLVSLFLIAVFSTSVYARNEICEPLKASSVSKGLYGLCIAYHASGANSQVILDIYNNKKTSTDPAMPGTDNNPPTLSCACWNSFTAEDIGTDPEVPPNFCALGLAVDFLFYDGIGGTELLNVGVGSCVYFSTVTGADNEITTLNPEQEDECRYEILGLAMRDFEDIGCLTSD